MKVGNFYQIFRITPVVIIFVIFSIAVCGCSGDMSGRLDRAELLMEEYPDSALSILDSIDVSALRGKRLKARYALLKSMALDKNYIDTTTFDVLQPAIDYYLENGSSDEKFKTYYYQGVIHSNAGNDNLAMISYLNGDEVEGEIRDSLALARMLVAQGSLYFKQYKISDFIGNNLRAARIYNFLNKPAQRLRCYLKAIRGEIILNNKEGADSLAAICRSLVNDSPPMKIQVLNNLLSYVVRFGNESEIREMIRKVEEDGDPGASKINLALAYTKIGEPKIGMQNLESVKKNLENIMDSMSYWSIKTEILHSLGENEKALECFRKYSRLHEKFDDALFSNGLLFSEKQHEIEMESLMKLQKKDSLLKLSIWGIILLVCIVALFYYRSRLNKAARTIAEQKADRLRLESDNLRLELGQLEEEHSKLTSLLEERKELEAPMQEAIRKRLDMLNSLLAKEITANESYAKPYREWIDSIRNDRKEFMNSTRVVFQASHPEFICFLQNHGLTDDEINYVCLYAIGLRGKEVGEYIQLKRHYNISSEIRSKLGIDEHSANLGPYIRKLMNQVKINEN